MNAGETEEKRLTNFWKSRRMEYYSKIYCTKCIEGGQAREFDKPIELILLNVSTGGLGILSETLFENGAVLALDMKLEEENYEKVSARVMWGIKKGNMYRYGLEIINISGKLFNHLRRLDNSIITRV